MVHSSGKPHWEVFLKRLDPTSELGVWLLDPRAQVIRDQVSDWIRLLSEGQQNRMLRGLEKSPRSQFLSSYNELAVGALLRGCGYQVLYEHTLDGQRPDWIVQDGEGLRFLLEVRTFEESNPMAEVRKSGREVVRQLRSLPLEGCWVTVEALPNQDPVAGQAHESLETLLPAMWKKWRAHSSNAPGSLVFVNRQNY